LFAGQDANFIIGRCRDFGYLCTDADVVAISKEIRSTASKNITSLFEARQPLDVGNEKHREWMQYYGVAELMTFMASKDKPDPPEYFKWVRDAIWINSVDEAQVITNALIFNGDDDEAIAAVLRFKYRRILSFEAVKLHRKIFFSGEFSSDVAIKYCLRMAGSTAVLRSISGETQMRHDDAGTVKRVDNDFGQTRELVFHDSNYIKWKIGYPEVKPPRAEDFLDKVMADASFRYYEAGQMQQFARRKFEEGTSAVTGQQYSNSVANYENVAEAQAKLMEKYTNIYIRAMKSKPNMRSSAAQDLIDKLSQLSIDFDTPDQIVPLNALGEDDIAAITAARSIGGDQANGQSQEMSPDELAAIGVDGNSEEL